MRPIFWPRPTPESSCESLAWRTQQMWHISGARVLVCTLVVRHGEPPGQPAGQWPMLRSSAEQLRSAGELEAAVSSRRDPWLHVASKV